MLVDAAFGKGERIYVPDFFINEEAGIARPFTACEEEAAIEIYEQWMAWADRVDYCNSVLHSDLIEVETVAILDARSEGRAGLWLVCKTPIPCSIGISTPTPIAGGSSTPRARRAGCRLMARGLGSERSRLDRKKRMAMTVGPRAIEAFSAAGELAGAMHRGPSAPSSIFSTPDRIVSAA